MRRCKTTTFETINECAERNGYAVEGFAPTSKADGQLRDAMIPPTPSRTSLPEAGRSRATV